MFTHFTIENKERKVTIPDVDSKIFKKVLDFIYTDHVDDLDSNAEKLLEAADKYQLQSLKEMCEYSLSKTLNVGNAIKIMILADRYYAKQLKEIAIDYVIANFDKFKNTEEFKALEQAQRPLFLIILKKCLAIGSK
ncbi:GSCOCG00011582001-RA-CDS [Cotesia congregata]|nr:GSCOCG00011582001-RA-CDS [Cotesia congregata]